MSNPLVSFIIPYYNAGTTIQETIDSIFNQSYPNFDIWLINDGSTDQLSIEKLNDFKGIDKIHILHQENAGPSIARNKAINNSSADFILPLDADNLIHEDSIQQAVIFLENHENISAVYGNIQFFGENKELKIIENYQSQKALIYSQIDTCALIRKKVFDEKIKYDEDLSLLGLEDWEFWINFHFHGLKSSYLNITFFFLRITYTSRTFEVANKNINYIKEIIIKKHHENFLDEYSKLYYDKKMLLETPDYRIGNTIIRPWRSLKKILNKLK